MAEKHETRVDEVPLPPRSERSVFTWQCSCGAEGGQDFLDRAAATRGAASHRKNAGSL